MPAECPTAPSVLEAAYEYISRGWRPVPVPPGEKAPQIKDWPRLRISEADLPNYFQDGDSIGLLLGEPSGCLVDVDLDCSEAIAVASQLLPTTGRTHGRNSRPGSHSWYIAMPVPNPARFTDLDGTSLAELRSTGQQTVVPPSVHPSGERLLWERNGEPAQVNGETLRCSVARLAAAALLARHWPAPGSRHEASLALAGMLLRARWSENEALSFVAAIARAARDEEWEARVANVRTTARRLVNDAAATGRTRLAQLLDPQVVQRVCEWLRRTPNLEILDSIGDSPTWPARLTSEAYHGLAGDFVRTIEPHTESDPVAILAQFLVSFGNCIGRSPYFSVEADRHFLNLFAVLVGATSKSRKGTSAGRVRQHFAEVDSAWTQNGQQSGTSSGEGLIYAVRDPVERLEPIRDKGRIVRYERVLADEGVSDKRLLVFEPEFAQPLKLMSREGNILSTVIRQAWDVGDLRTLTKTSPTRATGAHISVIGHITQYELRRLFGEAEQANGFGNRFLWLCVQRANCLPEGGSLPAEALKPLVERLQRAVEFGKAAGEMRRDDEAREIWRAVYPDLSEGKPGLLGAVTSRAEAQVLRLSCIYALLNCSAVIRPEHLLAALALWDYCQESARFIFGDALGDPLADELLRALRQSPDGMTRTEMSNLFGRHRSAKEIGQALTILAENGLVTCRLEPTAGRPEQRWFVLNASAKKAK